MSLERYEIHTLIKLPKSYQKVRFREFEKLHQLKLHAGMGVEQVTKNTFKKMGRRRHDKKVARKNKFSAAVFG